MMVRAVPVRTVMGMPGVRTGPWLVFTSVGMSRMIASYDGEGCTCENSYGDARCEDRSLACVHKCVDGLTCSRFTTK
jgi:hypothetical protein